MEPTTAPYLSPQDIRVQVTDFDQQVREAVEEGTIRATMKKLSPHIQSLFQLRHKGSDAQKSAFPRRLFLYAFSRAWNDETQRSDTNFASHMLAALKKFDATQTDATGRQAVPKKPVAQAAIGEASNQPLPRPMPRMIDPLPRSRYRSVSPKVIPARLVGPDPTKRVEVVITPRRKFGEIDKETDDEAGEGGGKPMPVPRAKLEEERRAAHVARTKGKGKKEARSESEDDAVVPMKKGRSRPEPAEEMEVDEVPERRGRPNVKARQAEEDDEVHEVVVKKEKTRGRADPVAGPSKLRRGGQESSKPGRLVRPTNRFHRTPCEKCDAANRDCEIDEGGGACVTCKRSKYRCDYSVRKAKEQGQGHKRKKPETEDEDEDEMDVEVMDVKKGRKRQADPQPLKVKEMEVPRRKGKSQPKARRYVEVSSEGAEGTESEAEEPRPKRPRTRHVEVEDYESDRLATATRLAKLEKQMVGIREGVEESRRTATRVASLESQVSRIAGPLEKILNSIHLDENFRLVPASRQLEAAPVQSREHSIPSDLHLEIPMDEDDEDDSGSALHGSSVPGTATTPSDLQDEGRMELDVAMQAIPGPSPAAAFVPTTAPVAPEVLANAVPDPAPTTTVVMGPPAPIFNVTPATPQGSQELPPTAVLPRPSPPVLNVGESLPLPQPATRGRARSRTPATGLAPPDGRITRSRSKTPK